MASNFAKEEVILKENKFKKIDSVKGERAIAVNLQTLLITEPGTSPNDPLFGIGIGNFIHNVINDELMAAIDSKIKIQVAKYMADINIAEIQIIELSENLATKYRGENVKGSKSLGITITIEPENGINTLDDLITIGFTFANSANGKLISNVVL